MSIISPFPQNTTIRLYKNVPWGNDYSEIRLFDNASQRDTFLNTLLIEQFSQCSIVKTGKSIKLTGQINDYLTCNYMQFTNYGIGQSGNLRSFFAFVTAINYVAINTFEIEYEIDWVQSFLFEFTIGECFVEREHVNDDSFGKNTVPENIDIGEYCIYNVYDQTYAKAYRLLYLSEADKGVSLKKKNGIAYGVNYIADTYDNPWGTVSEILQELNTYGGANEVVDFVMCAAPMVTNTNGLHDSFNVNDGGKEFKFGTTTYNAVNNKMRCYPYKLMSIDNYEGSVEQYRFENFADTSFSFAVEGTAMPKPCMECFPINYMGWRGTSESPNTVQQFSVMFTNFPEIPWTCDTFRAWVSQNSATLVGNGVSKVVQAGMGAAMLASGNIAGVLPLANAAIGAAQQVQDIENHRIYGSELQGTIPSAGMSYFRDTIGFRATIYCIRPEMAQKIDRFFTRYGYRVNASKIPNIRGRQYVNYVKTSVAHVDGEIPIDTKNILEKALNTGVSFWHVNTMDMELTNNPIIGG